MRPFTAQKVGAKAAFFIGFLTCISLRTDLKFAYCKERVFNFRILKNGLLALHIVGVGFLACVSL